MKFPFEFTEVNDVGMSDLDGSKSTGHLCSWSLIEQNTVVSAATY